jgi:nitrous oxidase accessory protein NosD
MRSALPAILVALGLAALAGPAAARTLLVGPGQTFQVPSDAVVSARPGDTIRILPGRYADCAVWRADDLTIEGAGPGVVITGKVCRDEALFVITGDRITVRNLTFTGARAGAHNGAGIRAQGTGLLVEDSRFIDNEEGILSSNNPDATIIVRHSYFRGNGNCIAACAHGIYAGDIALLRVEHSRFLAQHIGHHIKSRALRTEILDNSIADGPRGSSSYLLDLPDGGDILIAGNHFEKGPKSQNHTDAIAIGTDKRSESRDRTDRIAIRDNDFTNDLGGPTAFVLDCIKAPIRLRNNRFVGPVTPVNRVCPTG